MEGGRISRRRNETIRRATEGPKTRDTATNTPDANELHDAGPTDDATDHATQHANVAATHHTNEMVTTRGDKYG